MTDKQKKLRVRCQRYVWPHEQTNWCFQFVDIGRGEWIQVRETAVPEEWLKNHGFEVVE